jgi:hypothetical protein
MVKHRLILLASPLAARLHIAVEPTPLTGESLADRWKSQHANL